MTIQGFRQFKRTQFLKYVAFGGFKLAVSQNADVGGGAGAWLMGRTFRSSGPVQLESRSFHGAFRFKPTLPRGQRSLF